MKRITIALATALSITGCATVMNDSTHPMRIDTLTEDGRLVTGATCTLSNDKSHSNFTSGETVQVRRSARDLDISCQHPDYPAAIGRATSRTNAGMWGNILVGGAVGMIVDHNKGTAYTYPTWVRMVFGWVTAFDRREEDSGTPLDGERVSRTAPPAPAPEAAELKVEVAVSDHQEAVEPSVEETQGTAPAPAQQADPAPEQQMKWQWRGW